MNVWKKKESNGITWMNAKKKKETLGWSEWMHERRREHWDELNECMKEKGINRRNLMNAERRRKLCDKFAWKKT